MPSTTRRSDPVEQVMELTRGLGADRGCECVGWQAHDPQGHEHPNMTLNNLVKSVRATGGLGVVGVFTQDPKSPDKLLKEGEVASTSRRISRRASGGLGTVRCEAIQPEAPRADPHRRAPRRRSSCPTSWRSTRHRTPTSTSTPGTTDGPRWSCTRVERPSSGGPSREVQAASASPSDSGPCQCRQTRGNIKAPERPGREIPGPAEGL